MKGLLFAAAGVLCGALLSTFTAACGFCEARHDMPPDSYHSSTLEADYLLVLDANNTLTETYTRGGKAYVVKYAAKR